MMKNIKQSYRYVLALLSAFLLVAVIPLSASAHYINPNTTFEYMAAVGVDGHDHELVPEPIIATDGNLAPTHAVGASELLVPWSTPWFGLLAVSIVITGGLSFLVWKYLQVPAIKKTTPGTPSDKK